MPGRWNDDRDQYGRQEYGRETRYGRNERDRDRERDPYGGYGEGRSFHDRDHEARLEGPDRDRVFGEEDTGGAYNTRERPGPGGRYGGGSDRGGSYGRSGAGSDNPSAYGSGGRGDRSQGGGTWSYGGRSSGREEGMRGRDDYGRRPSWQDRDYGGVSPAMQQGEYEAQQRAQRFQSQDYTHGGGRFYGDDARQRIFRQEYGDWTPDHGSQRDEYESGYRDYRAGGSGGDREFRREEGLYGDRDVERRYEREMRRPAAGGTGGYDYERGYGDAGRRDEGRDGRRGEGAGDFLSRAGERISAWFGNAVGEVRRDLGPEGQGPRRYASDFGREPRWETEGHRGRGPKNYKRSDDRINEEVCQRLSDDPWLDASQIDVKVSAGEVTLSGLVDNREAKRRAERLVEDIAGVDNVQNDLRLSQSATLTNPGRGFGDSVLEAQMKRDGQMGGTTGSTAGTASSTSEDSASTRSTTRRS